MKKCGKNLTKNDFINNINKLRELRLKGAPFSQYKNTYEDFFNKEDPGEIYRLLFLNDVKSTVYTPEIIAKEVVEPIPKEGNILELCSGTGFITSIILKEEKTNDENNQNKNNNEYSDKNFHLTVTDEDDTALRVLTERMYYEKLKVPETITDDFLNLSGTYDAIYGNPPYSGHKDLTIEEKKELKNRYPLIFTDKADLFYTFFPKAHSLLKLGGILSFVVSRYFLESESAKGLRIFILENFTILKIHDYYGVRLFGSGVDPVIIHLKKKDKVNIKEKELEERKEREVVEEEDYSFEAIRNDEKFICKRSYLSYDSLRPVSSKEDALIKVMENICSHKLGEVGNFYQGVITGCDKAFILEEENKNVVEEELLRKWIKSSHLTSNNIKNFYLILPPDDLSKYPKFSSHIKDYEDKLKKRREIALGKIPWHKLQWGRDENIFLKRRIIFPYKASKSNFKIGENIWHSADVYSFIPQDKYINTIVEFLNSPFYDSFIKLYLKKLGKDLYDYYPNRLKKVPFPLEFIKSGKTLEEFISLVEKNLKK